MIVSNQVECLLCGDKPFSSHRHDYQPCKCGAVAVDGGTSYLRRVGGMRGIKELSIDMPEKAVDDCIAAVEWGLETGRNARGIAYAVFRALRDNDYNLNREEDEQTSDN